MSGILVVLEERDGRVSRASWEALAAGQYLAAKTNEPVSVAVLGANTEATAAEAAAKAVAKVDPHRSPAARAIHARRVHFRIAAAGPERKPHASRFSAHVPGARFCSGAGRAIGPGAHQRRGRDRRRPGIHAAAHAGAAHRQLPPLGQRTLPGFCAGRSIPRRCGTGRDRGDQQLRGADRCSRDPHQARRTVPRLGADG